MLAVRGIFVFATPQFKLALSIPFEWPSTASSFQLAFLWKCGRIPDPCPWCARAKESLASQAFERAQVLPAQNWPAENSLRWGKSARRDSAIRRPATHETVSLR